jgi:hypothetical protein
MGDSPMQGPRRSFRHARYATKVSCQVVRERDFQLVADRVVDLSPSGALVGPADPVLTGERVIVSFPGADGEWVDAEATVARVVHGRRRGEYTRTLGLSFESVDAESKRALCSFLKTRVPKAPGQRSRPRRAVARGE